MAARSGGRSRAKLDGVRVEIRTAADILTPERVGEWAARRAQRNDPLLRAIWREFVEAGGPVMLEAAARALPGLARDALGARATALDAADLIELEGDRVRLAYPFTAEPNDFEVVLPGERSRYACCAIDALGVAPMIGLPVTLRARCHQSGAPLVFDVDPVSGPRRAPPGCLAWVERGRWGGDRLSGFL
jgi:Alkylmercury lyase